MDIVRRIGSVLFWIAVLYAVEKVMDSLPEDVWEKDLTQIDKGKYKDDYDQLVVRPPKLGCNMLLGVCIFMGYMTIQVRSDYTLAMFAGTVTVIGLLFWYTGERDKLIVRGDELVRIYPFKKKMKFTIQDIKSYELDEFGPVGDINIFLKDGSLVKVRKNWSDTQYLMVYFQRGVTMEEDKFKSVEE